jgi:hypothetical protein
MLTIIKSIRSQRAPLPAGIIGIPGWLRLEQVAAIVKIRNRRAAELPSCRAVNMRLKEADAE